LTHGVTPPTGPLPAGRRAIATARRTGGPIAVRARLRARRGGSSVGEQEVSGRVMGVRALHRGGALAGVLAACLVLAAPGAAQSPSPDAAAPGPSPDPAPTKTQPAKRPAKPAAAVPTTTQSTTPQVEEPAPTESSPDSGALATTTQRASTPRRTDRPKKRRKPSATRRVAASTALPMLPRIEPARLLAAPSDDADRARSLAVGAIALLLLALASATLLAVTARLERRRLR
jgi:hypothetical protein